MEEGAGAPFVVFLGVAEAFFALRKGNGLVVHGLGCLRELSRRVGVHLFEFSTTGARHGGKFSRY